MRAVVSTYSNRTHGRSLETVQLLLEKGAQVNAQDEKGKTALMRAAFAGDTEAVRLLLEKGAQVNVQDSAGDTALMHAAGNVPSVELLLKHGADRNIKNAKGWTALDHVRGLVKYEEQTTRSTDRINDLQAVIALLEAKP